MLAIIILMIIAIILGGLAAYQLYAVTQTQNLLIQSQKNMSSIAMWKTMLISKAKAVGYENEIVLPYGDNTANYQTPPKWVYFNTKNPWGKDIIYCPLSSHNSGTVNNTVAVTGGSYGVETKNNFATVFNGSAKNYVVSSNASFGVNTTGVLAFLISPTPSTVNQLPSCANITFDESDNIYKVANGLVDVITKGDVETFANLSMLASQNEGATSSAAYLTTVEGDSSVTGNTFNANLNYIVNSDINYAHLKLPSGVHSIESLNIGGFDSNYHAVKKTLIIEGEADGSTYIEAPSSATLEVNNYNLVLVNVNIYKNILMNVNNSILKTYSSTVGNVRLKLSDWIVTDNTSVISSNMSSTSIELKDSKLIVLVGNTLAVTEKSGNEMAIQVATSQLVLDDSSKIAINKAGNLNTIVLIDSKMTIDRAFIETTSTGSYNNDIYVDDASQLSGYNGVVNGSGRTYDTIALGGVAILRGTSVIPKSTSAGIGISLYNGSRLTMQGVTGHPSSIGSASARYNIPVHDVDGTYAGGLPSAGGDVTLYAINSEDSACASGYLFGYSESNRGTGQTTKNDYALIEDETLSAIISKLNASNWICNK